MKYKNQGTHMPLSGQKIAIPETRQLDTLARLLEKKGADILRCPLVGIHDAPDEARTLAWLKGFIALPADDLIILTGEGLRRLSALAERHDLLDDWKAALAKTRKIARGPKPGKALRELGLRSDLLGEQPTTDGIIASLEHIDLAGRKVAVQLYGEDPNDKLMGYLADRELDVSTVAPYVYASEVESESVESLIKIMAAGDVDMICFTSQPQLKRLQSVARKTQMESTLEQALLNTHIAAVGPVMGDLLRSQGYKVAVQPQNSFFMGDLVAAIVESIRPS